MSMNNLQSRIIVALLLLLSAFASVADSQTRRSSVASRRNRRHVSARAARIESKPNAPCPVSLATTTLSGLTYIITRHGSGGQLKAGETVMVHYTGLLTNGTKFDSSLERNEPFAFQLGAGRVIKGWDEGIAQLHVGDQATLIIPPQLGYGARGAGGVIPPDAALIFIIEVVGTKDATPAGNPSPGLSP